MSISFTDKLAARIEKTGSALCVGLDPRPVMDDLQAVPVLLRKVVEETAPYAAAFKPNIAYFEAMGLRGLEMLEELLPDMPDDVPVVLDVKRGDIGETQKYYAQAYFERLGVDAVTLSPFMGYRFCHSFQSRPALFPANMRAWPSHEGVSGTGHRTQYAPSPQFSGLS